MKTSPPQKFPLGKSDFKNVIEGDYYFVDKSMLIHQIINDNSEILLFPRPRRFGKTLNIKMLRYFFKKNNPPQTHLFEKLAIRKQSTWEHQALAFMRVFLGSALKDNPFVFKGIITGILRIARESIFSELNNIDVYSILSEDFCEFFGITQAEVHKILQEFNLMDHQDIIAKLYYKFRKLVFPIAMFTDPVKWK